MLFPTQKIAETCRSFIHDRSSKAGTPFQGRLCHLLICPEDKANKAIVIDSDYNDCRASVSSSSVDLHIVLFPAPAFSFAKEFWQHTGMGISSRLAEHCLSMLPDDSPQAPSPTTPRFSSKVLNRHYAAKGINNPPKAKPPVSSPQVDDLTQDHSVYLEERYGRNLPITSAASAKRALRRRISGVLVRDSPDDCPNGPCAGDENLTLGPSSRGVAGVSENDVYLYPGGMAAIWSAHQIALSLRKPTKSVCFGFVHFPLQKHDSTLINSLQVPVYRHPQSPPEMGPRLPFSRTRDRCRH